MTKLLLSVALLLAGTSAATLAFLHYPPVRIAAQHAVSPGELSPKHAYLADRCVACHEPGIGVTVAKCTVCHATSERLLGRQPTMFHASISECTTCHVEHQRKSARPLAMDHIELVRVGARSLERASRNDADSAATLASLKTWLRVKRIDQLDESSAREALNCASGHDRNDPHFKRFGSDCAQCHTFNTWTVSGYQHPSPRSTDCVQCHQAPPSHFMGHFSMVDQTISHKGTARVDQCFQCHNTNNWNDIVDVGFFKMH
jgi:hypothetical protein